MDWDPTQKYAFVDNDTKVLQAWGYMATNCRLLQPQCDQRIEVVWDFDLEPGKWRYDNGTWVPYSPPA